MWRWSCNQTSITKYLLIVKIFASILWKLLQMENQSCYFSSFSSPLDLTLQYRCTHCHHNIVRGAPRIRVCFRSPNDWVYHRCLTCVTDQILSNIKAEWTECIDPLKAFVAAQPSEVIACFQNENPNMPHHVGAEGDQDYVVQKLYQYADAGKHTELTEGGQKRPLTTWKEGETIVVPVGKKTKKFSTEGSVIITSVYLSSHSRIHESLRSEIEAFLETFPSKLADVVTTQMNSAMQSSDSLDEVENQVERENTLPGSAGQSDIIASVVKTITKTPEHGTRSKMNVKVNRNDRSHIVE
jgi:hypothetical protein